ncbi:MAG TPA: dNTP triphosphohydrolase [Haliangium sp.]|nr:dNTP triphosphohydrolase [Haliangium sp.]
MDVRTAFELDYDRLLFSTPVRRLADKTQVFPLERNDSVRTRLTHSHEVANLAKSIGTRLIRTYPMFFGTSDEVHTDEIRNAVPIILATIGLAHDLGNPPFGHQGEVAIRHWFIGHQNLFTDLQPGSSAENKDFSSVPVAQQTDFTKFEGNAQALRLVTRLQNTSGPSGLNLTAATLAALMKYPVASHQTSDSYAATKKHGYFASEADVVEWIREETGLSAGQRHPLTWIMEASDDIAYSVLDVEDAIKKGLISAEDVLAYLRSKFEPDDLDKLIEQLTADFDRADKDEYSLSRVREIKVGYLRTRLIDRLVTGATNAYHEDRDAIFNHGRKQPLLGSDSEASKLCESLKKFARVHAYQSTGVLRLELTGSIVIRTLMDAMWEAISEREDFSKPGSRRLSPKAAYVYSLISDSYRWHFERSDKKNLATRYKELQLLSDMISGMTDGYALDLYEKIQRHDERILRHASSSSS